MTTVAAKVRHFTRVADLGPGELEQLLELAARLKQEPARYEGALHGRTVACIFEKPSTRTRVSFAAAAAELGATPITLSPQELQIGRGESIADTARSLSGYCAAIVIRTFAQRTVDELAAWATVPVVNALSDEHHPCQALADLLTIREARGGLHGRRLAFLGDGGDNVAHSLLEAAALSGLDVAIACPPAYAPRREILEEARRLAGSTGATLSVVESPREAITGADAVYADVWASMGEEAEHEARARSLAPYEVTEELIVVCAGGGGIPVVREGDRLRGVEAVIDKDLTAALLAEQLHADRLLMLTDVHYVERGWRTPEAAPIEAASPAELRELEFAAGSMAPKVEAACRFVERNGGEAVIGALGEIAEVATGRAGTRVRAVGAASLR